MPRLHGPSMVVGRGGAVSIAPAVAAASGFDPETASAVVTGAGSPELNVTYPRAGSVNGRAYFQLAEVGELAWSGVGWEFNGAAGGGYNAYLSPKDVEYPWLATAWEVADGTPPAPTVAAG